MIDNLNFTKKLGLKPSPSRGTFDEMLEYLITCENNLCQAWQIKMLVFEAKIEGKKQQYEWLHQAVRTACFIRNSCVRYWMDNREIGRYTLSAYCAVLAKQFPWANKLNSMARQAYAERTWSAIARFYDNCKKKVTKKGFPRFKKHQTHSSVEYKTRGWKLSEERRHITFTDGFKAGSFKLWGTRDLHFYQLNQIKRVRVFVVLTGATFSFALMLSESRNESQRLRPLGWMWVWLISTPTLTGRQLTIHGT